ncbi:MAG: hypothetical protein DBX45_09205 [Oscillospiraceae bacterium]|nr:MAG: hypothetical protein DBX45_09205 [Oscillospiraceae bacterium]
MEDVPLGELDLTPGLIGRAREERGDAPLSWPEGKNGIDGPTVRLSLGRGSGRRAGHGHRTHRKASPPFLQLGKCRPRGPEGDSGAFGWLRERPIRSMCSAEIGNQPLVIYIGIARWTGTILSSSGSILLFSASRSNAI